MSTNYSTSLQTKVVNVLGMHARPAAKIAEIAMTAKDSIWLSDGKNTVDASSIIDILTLCAVTGTCITILAENTEDNPLADQIKAYFDEGFGEEIHE